MCYLHGMDTKYDMKERQLSSHPLCFLLPFPPLSCASPFSSRLIPFPLAFCLFLFSPVLSTLLPCLTLSSFLAVYSFDHSCFLLFPSLLSPNILLSHLPLLFYLFIFLYPLITLLPPLIPPTLYFLALLYFMTLPLPNPSFFSFYFLTLWLCV